MATFLYDVFISHNRADKAWAQSLAARLERETWSGRRLRVFFDKWDIAPGQNIPIAIENALRDSRKIALVVSPASLDSEWVEMERAIATALDPAGRRRRLIPLLLSGSNHTLPPLLVPLRYIDFRQTEAFETSFRELLREIRDEPPNRDDDNNSSVDPMPLREEFKTYFLAQASHRCSICHTGSGVDLYRIDMISGNARTERNDLIALCYACRLRAASDRLSARQLESVRNKWETLCRTSQPVATANDEMEKTFSEALRLSLGSSIWDIKRARILCLEILNRYNPFHADARILEEKLLQVEKKLEREIASEDVRFHAPVSGGSLALLLIPAILAEEYGHAVLAWALGVVRNAQGRRMPLRRHFQYVEVNGMPVGRGLADARRRGTLDSADFNLSKAQRDWFAEIEF